MEPPPFRDIRSSRFYILMQLMSMMTIFIIVFEEFEILTHLSDFPDQLARVLGLTGSWS